MLSATGPGVQVLTMRSTNVSCFELFKRGQTEMRSNHRIPSRIASYLITGVFVVSAVSYAQAVKSGTEILKKVADIPMPGPAVRFDYQTFDPSSGRLYIAHMNADQLVVFDTLKRQVVANLDGFKRVHGVTVAPEMHRLYASVTGSHQVAAVDTESLKTLGTAGPIAYPDGLAYAPKQNKVFVSDEHNGIDAVIDSSY
jgi:DNA-binding beta-propeller fold protein YncE